MGFERFRFEVLGLRILEVGGSDGFDLGPRGLRVRGLGFWSWRFRRFRFRGLPRLGFAILQFGVHTVSVQGLGFSVREGKPAAERGVRFGVQGLGGHGFRGLGGFTVTRFRCSG